jgi:ChpA-C
MKKVRWLSAAAGTALVAATFALPGAGVAYASGNGNITGNGNLSLLSGNTVNAPISAPVNLCGVSLAVLGFSNSGCQGGATSTISGVGGGSDNGNVTGNFNVPVVSGNTVNAPVSTPVNVCGVSGAVAGYANSHCQGGATSTISGVGGHSHNGNVTGNFNVPVGSGNTVNAPVSTPVNVCGVSGAVAGYANSHCQGGATSTISGVGGHSHNGNVLGNYNVPVLSGNTVNTPVSAPVNVCGISLALLGFSNAGCEGGSTSCIGDQCAPPMCQGDHCTPPPCEDHCQTPPPCEDHCQTPPPCEHNCNTPPPCEDNCQTPPPCEDHCNTPPPCEHNCNTPPPCEHNCNTPPPSCQGNCTPPTGTPPHGTGPGTTTTVTTGTTPSGSLPTTGADLLLLGVAALGSIGVGAGTVALARRRRNGEAS